jgi:uncharacterized protein YpmB
MTHEPHPADRAATHEPAAARTEVVRTRTGTGAWWLAAIVAIVAIVGLTFLFASQNGADLQAAREEGAAQATLENATTSAQQAAVDASRAAQQAVEGAARASETAAASAADAADRTAQAAQDGAAATAEAVQDAAPAPQ